MKTMSFLLLFPMAMLAAGTVRAEDAVLEAGKYHLTLKLQGVPEGQKAKSQAAQVSKIGEKTLVIDTVDGLGKPLQLKGIAAPGFVKFGVTKVEGKGLVTIHFLSDSTKPARPTAR